MRKAQARFTSIDGGGKRDGLAGGHTVVADRPEGKAGGQGLGFNGAELLALAVDECFCNDLRYIAHRLKRPIARLSVEVDLHLDGDPIMATRADLTVNCMMADVSDPSALVAERPRRRWLQTR